MRTLEPMLVRRSHRLPAGWAVIEWALFATWLTAAILNMGQRRAGFLTNHAADLTLPAWLYVVFRSTPHANPVLRRHAPSRPAATACFLFAASTATEISQYFWPHGPFAGTCDPLDVAAYGCGLGACFLADLRWPIRHEGSASDEPDAAT
jgi:hypothetical protein